MRCIGCWDDLSHYGIVALSENVYGASRYILCKVTAQGKKTLETALGVAQLPLHQHGRRGHCDALYVGSIMLAPGLLPVIGIYALRDSGCGKVWLMKNGELIGVEPSDNATTVEAFIQAHADSVIRCYTYAGQAGDPNQLTTSGWIH